jgi:hypothetical protein
MVVCIFLFFRSNGSKRDPEMTNLTSYEYSSYYLQPRAGHCRHLLKERRKKESFFFHLFFSEGQENLSFCFFFLVLSFRKISHKTIV